MREINNNSQQSAESLSNELLELCNSESLSTEGLRELIARYGVTPNNHPVSDYNFFHQACANKRINEEIVKYLLEYFPAAAYDADDYGRMPLHKACWNKNVMLSITQLLINAAPDSVRRVDNNGWMPLHTLCGKRILDEAAAMQILKLLIEYCPEAIRHANNSGCFQFT